MWETRKNTIFHVFERHNGEKKLEAGIRTILMLPHQPMAHFDRYYPHFWWLLTEMTTLQNFGVWISASIWQRAIEILSIPQAVRILMTPWNRIEWLISDPVLDTPLWNCRSSLEQYCPISFARHMPVCHGNVAYPLRCCPPKNLLFGPPANLDLSRKNCHLLTSTSPATG